MYELFKTMTAGLLAGLLVVGTGCGGGVGGPAAGQATSPTEQAALEDLAALLKSVAEQKRKPPTKLAELDQYEPLFMAAYKGVSSGKVVYIWGHGYAAGNSDVVAYESATETAGGLVLLQDGTLKRLSADEFKAAPKAKAAGGKK